MAAKKSAPKKKEPKGFPAKKLLEVALTALENSAIPMHDKEIVRQNLEVEFSYLEK